MLVLAAVADKPAATAPCLPRTASPSGTTPSAVEEHRALRKAVGEPMPQSPTMVMLYGKGGHLSTEEYSIILVKAADGIWRGTAVGRSQIWIKDAPYSPMKRVEWVLNEMAGRQLDAAISHPCLLTQPSARSANAGPPPIGFIPEHIDVLVAGHTPSTFYSEEGDAKIAALIRPPQQ